MKGQAPQSSESEFTVLQRYGVRWAVLAAWHADLAGHGVALEADLLEKLEEARTRIATGCYSTCTIGCDLGWIEGTLVSRAATFDPATVDPWLEMLGRAMAEPEKVSELLGIPAIGAQYLKCGFRPCECSD